MTSAVWRERIVKTDTPADDTIGVNEQCFDWARMKIVHFLQAGVYATNDHTAIVIPATPRCREITCKHCNARFMLCSLMFLTNHTLACSSCRGFFCKECSDQRGRVAQVASSEQEVMDAWLCRHCVADRERAAAAAKKKRKKADRAAKKAV